MVAKKESAEQKLLQMIEASGGAAGSGGLSAKKPEKKSKPKMSTLAILSICSKVLILLVIVAAVLLFREISIGSKMVKRPVAVSIDNFEKSMLDVNTVLPTLQDLKYYLRVIGKRNIFKPYVPPKANTTNVVVTPKDDGLEITKKTESLKLVGISWMDRVETASVMIEDIDKNVTYFLQKGEKLNDIIIKTIYADSALLGYKDEEIIIKYEKSQ